MKKHISKKVLIVDEESIRESLKLILSDHYNLILTSSSEQALDCLKNDKTIGMVVFELDPKQVANIFAMNEGMGTTGEAQAVPVY